MVYFTDRQYSRQPWLWLLVAAIAVAAWSVFVQQVIRGKPVGENPMSDWGVVIVVVLFGLGLPALIWFMHVETTVTSDRVVIRVVPFTRREVIAGDIVRFSGRSVSPIREFGGWGIRGLGGNRAYLMSGNTGVQVILTNGDRVLIGTKRTDELVDALNRLVAGR